MGQQQLLLLVLGIVIVGLAVVVGIQAFSENQKKANADAMVMDGLRVASDLQAWMLKPVAFGGAGNSQDWTGASAVPPHTPVSFQQIGYEETAGVYTNLNGNYTLNVTPGEVVIEGTSLQGSLGGDNLICVHVLDTTPEGITTEIYTLSTTSTCP